MTDTKESPQGREIADQRLEDLLYSIETKLILKFRDLYDRHGILDKTLKFTDQFTKWDFDKISEEIKARLEKMEMIKLGETKSLLLMNYYKLVELEKKIKTTVPLDHIDDSRKELDTKIIIFNKTKNQDLDEIQKYKNPLEEMIEKIKEQEAKLTAGKKIQAATKDKFQQLELFDN